MGILDFFKRSKGTEQDNKQVADNMPEQKLILRYSSGERADVVFGNNVEIDGKMLKEVEVCYTLDERKEDSLFIAKKIFKIFN